MAVRFVILHYHILKNAGTTIENILDRNFGERLARLDTPDRDGRIEQADIVAYLDRHPAVEAVSSHQIHYPVPAARGYIFFDLCFLRDPIDRLRSTYDYFRHRPAPGDPVSDAANSLGIRCFMERLIERFPEQVDNPQVNLLANGEADRSTTPEDLARALERMRETSFLGVVDMFEESISAGRLLLRPIFPDFDAREAAANISRGLEGTLAARRIAFREACGSALNAELLRLTALDRQLLRQARIEVRCRLRLARSPEGAERAAGSPRGRRQTIRLPLISFGPLFDPGYYLARYPDVHEARIAPLRHYRKHGAAEGRQPHPLFDPAYYARTCHESRAAANPLLHFIESGASAANPHPLFDCAAYLRAHPEAAARNVNPLLHYLRRGRPEIRDIEAALQQNPDAAEPQQLPFYRAIRPDQLAAQRNSNSR